MFPYGSKHRLRQPKSSLVFGSDSYAFPVRVAASEGGEGCGAEVVSGYSRVFFSFPVSLINLEIRFGVRKLLPKPSLDLRLTFTKQNIHCLIDNIYTVKHLYNSRQVTQADKEDKPLIKHTDTCEFFSVAVIRRHVIRGEK